ncbi:MAG: 2-C-methyl-D-erythritol 4-phosphate cytidylyltransferase [Gemmatimonadetes bacterium]|nr:2-C-methyl-D-erythritol 4-phosphate cytidylyltransferase [Gemmatimonadota bacterium]
MDVRAAALIPAAGGGRRLGGVRKAFLEIGGQPMLRRTLGPFIAEPRICQIVIALDPESVAAPPAWLSSLDPRIALVPGGDERGDSVRAALAAVGDNVDIVLVHDAARPFVSGGLVARALEAAAAGQCVVAAVPATDTIQEVDVDGVVVRTLDRRMLWHAQTPQAFPRRVLVDAYTHAASHGIRTTDDAALVMARGVRVRVLEGDAANIKITTPTDVALAAFLLSRA